jgi:hypothetical protein
MVNTLSPIFLLSLPSRDSRASAGFELVSFGISLILGRSIPAVMASARLPTYQLVFVLKMGDISWISQGHLSPKPFTSFINYLASRTRINTQYGT